MLCIPLSTPALPGPAQVARLQPAVLGWVCSCVRIQRQGGGGSSSKGRGWGDARQAE